MASREKRSDGRRSSERNVAKTFGGGKGKRKMMRMWEEVQDIQTVLSRPPPTPQPAPPDVCSWSFTEDGYGGTSPPLLGSAWFPVAHTGRHGLQGSRLDVARDDFGPLSVTHHTLVLNQRIPRPSILNRPALSCFEAPLVGMRVDWGGRGGGVLSTGGCRHFGHIQGMAQCFVGRPLMRRDGVFRDDAQLRGGRDCHTLVDDWFIEMCVALTATNAGLSTHASCGHGPLNASTQSHAPRALTF